MRDMILVVGPQEMDVIDPDDLFVLDIHDLLVENIPPDGEFGVDRYFLEAEL